MVLLGSCIAEVHGDDVAGEHQKSDSTSITVSQAVLSPSQFDAALSRSADGYSTDELLIREDLRALFLDELRRESQESNNPFDSIDETTIFKWLLRYRKAGKLSYRASKRGRSPDESIVPVAEIAARVVMDRHRITSDDMLMDAVLCRELQQEAEILMPGIDAYLVRKAILSLRKKRALKPELVLQVAQWGREVKTYTLSQLKDALRHDTIAKQPGVYLFRTPTGYLYIGEAANLATRLTQHTTSSDRRALADHLSVNSDEEVSVELHIFQSDSPAKNVTFPPSVRE